MQAQQLLQRGHNVTSANGPRHLQRGGGRRGTQSGNPVTQVMTPMWSSLEGGLLPIRKPRPKPAPRPPSENAKARAKDVQVRV